MTSKKWNASQSVLTVDPVKTDDVFVHQDFLVRHAMMVSLKKYFNFDLIRFVLKIVCLNCYFFLQMWMNAQNSKRLIVSFPAETPSGVFIASAQMVTR